MTIDHLQETRPETTPRAVSAVPAHRPGVRENLRRLGSAQKSGDGVPAYTRWVNRRAARIVAATAAAAGVTPNGVTALSAALSVSGLAVLLIAGPQWWSAILCGALLAAGYVFDSADGQVARLTGTGAPAGEWLDHVVDAARTPMIHLSVAVTVMLHRPDLTWLAVIGLCFAVLSTAQFMSQILAEQLIRHKGGEEPTGTRITQSLILLPSDSGVLCWSFVLWLAPPLFALGYTVLFALNAMHTLTSMRRKYLKLLSA